jgi:hypothetical protein
MATDTRNPTGDDAASIVGTISGTPGSRYTLVNDYPDTGGGRTTLTIGADAIGGGTILFTFTAFTVPSGSTSISIDVLYHDEDAVSGTNAAAARLQLSGSPYTAGEHDPGTFTARTDSWATNPATSAAWTAAEVNAIERFGWRCRDDNPGIKFSDIQLKVTYTPPIKSINGLLKASIKSVNGLVAASIKAINGLGY